MLLNGGQEPTVSPNTLMTVGISWNVKAGGSYAISRINVISLVNKTKIHAQKPIEGDDKQPL